MYEQLDFCFYFCDFKGMPSPLPRLLKLVRKCYQYYSFGY